MGEVYRARDTRLGREVALKILPEAFASDPDRLMRFEREARTLASLNHPNLAQVHGLEDSGGTRALVMELVAGEDLSARVARGPIPLDEALPIARQIAEALEAAHEAGIIHRDLKPANVKVRDDGTVKVLDFGLAKALDPVASDASGDGATITSPAMTMRGVILGTAAYMAPEQAKGKPVDRRADIWAFGCVLYEMLTGTRAFKGDDITDTLTAVLRDEPDWTALPAATPAHIATLARRCLVKEPRDRLRDIGEARLTLGGAWLQVAPPGQRSSERQPGISARRGWAVLLAALAAGSAIGAIWMSRGRTEPAAAPVYAASLLIADELTRSPAARMAVSPDGTRLAYVAADGNTSARLWLRSLNGASGQAIAGTEGAFAPFWSPDSRSIAFFSEGRLRRVDIAGGPSMTVCELPQAAPGGPSGAWSTGGVILFGSGALYRVSASGGAPTPVTSIEKASGETAHRHPFFLPGGQRFLFVTYKGPTPLATYAGSLDGEPRRQVMAGGSNVQYASGALLYMRDSTLLSQRFDPGRLATSGSAVPVAESVMSNVFAGGGAFTVSQTGVLVFQGAQRLGGGPLVWATRDGRQTPVTSDPAIYRDVALSPDGTRVALTPFDGEASDLWILDLERQVRTRLTFDGTAENAVWSPDGRTVVYNALRDGTRQIFRRAVDGSGEELAVFTDDRPKWPLSWSSSGLLLFARQDPRESSDIWAMRLDAPARPEAVVAGPSPERWGQFSPDGRWLAYTSDESGRREVYVRGAGGAGGRWQVSTAGGTYPRWRRDGRELFYVSPTNRMVATPIGLGEDSATLGQPVDLFPARPFLGFDRIFYDVGPDGRFLLAAYPEKLPTAELTLLVNWPTLLAGTNGTPP
jgi:Tol biopolymer transport system component